MAARRYSPIGPISKGSAGGFALLQIVAFSLHNRNVCTTAFRIKREALLTKSWHCPCSFGTQVMEDNTEPLRFLTTHETAELLQVSRRTMERMINRKDLPAFKIASQWRVHETALATWLEGLQARKPLNQSE